MGQRPFDALIQLVQFDQYINTINADIQSIQTAIDLSNQNKVRIQHHVSESKAILEHFQKKIHTIEREISSLDVQEKAKKELLSTIADKKSGDALRKEIQLLKQEQHAHEEELLHVWNKVEVAQKEYDHMFHQARQQMHELEKHMHAQEEQLQQLLHRQADAYVQRPAKEEQIPVDWLEKYVRMREHVTDPVVPLIDAGCSSCFFSVSPQERLAIGRGALLACKGCYRFLYAHTDTITEQ